MDELSTQNRPYTPSIPAEHQEPSTPTQKSNGGVRAAIDLLKAITPSRRRTAQQKRAATTVLDRNESPTAKRQQQYHPFTFNSANLQSSHTIANVSTTTTDFEDDELEYIDPLTTNMQEDRTSQNPFAGQDNTQLTQSLETTLGDLETITNQLPQGFAIGKDQQHSLITTLNKLTNGALTQAILEIEKLSLRVSSSLESMHNSIQNVQKEMGNMNRTLDNRLQAIEKATTNPPTPTQRTDITPTTARARSNGGTDAPRQNPTTKGKADGKREDARKPENQNPTSRHHPSRLVIQFEAEGLSPKDRPDPSKLVKDINDALTRHRDSAHIRVVAVKWNANGNCVIRTRADQKAEELIKFKDRFVDIIAGNRQTKARIDKKWIKVQVNGIRTGAFDFPPTLYSPETIHEELKANNPAYADLNVIVPPRWMRSNLELRCQGYSSVMFATDDEDKAITLLKDIKSLAAFGRNVFLRRYADRPPVIQCKTCWKFDHVSVNCAAKDPRCPLCGENHTEEEHARNCQICKERMRETGLTYETGEVYDPLFDPRYCDHNIRCLHCKVKNPESADHPAYARRCPERIQRYGTARNYETTRPTQRREETNGWTTVTWRQAKQKATYGKDKEKVGNRFGVLREGVEGPSVDNVLRQAPGVTREEVEKAMSNFTTTNQMRIDT